MFSFFLIFYLFMVYKHKVVDTGHHVEDLLTITQNKYKW